MKGVCVCVCGVEGGWGWGEGEGEEGGRVLHPHTHKLTRRALEYMLHQSDSAYDKNVIMYPCFIGGFIHFIHGSIHLKVIVIKGKIMVLSLTKF